MSVDLDDPKAELRLLVSALGAHLEWHAQTGAHGLPLRSGTGKEAQGGPSGPAAQESRASDLSAPKSPPFAASSPVQDQAETVPAPPVSDVGSLAELAARVIGCRACRLSNHRTQTVFSRGSGSLGLCFVGEAPGFDEDVQGEPFVGAAGQLLDRMIGAMGFSREEVYVCNIVKCRPPENRKPEVDEMAACQGFLARQLELVAPKVIVALGATAAQGLLGPTEGITRLRGKWKLYRGRVAVMPTFHPAYLLRNPKAKREVWQDLQAVVKYLGRALPPSHGG